MTGFKAEHPSPSYSRFYLFIVLFCSFKRARDLFFALWIPDLFMRRVESDGMWSLMCPNECPGLQDCWGEAFDKLYERYLTMSILVYAQLPAYHSD